MTKFKTVLITGAAGYLGSVLCARFLKEGWRVRALDCRAEAGKILAPFLDSPRFQLIQGDVRDAGVTAEVLNDAAVVIPAAAVVGAPQCDQNKKLAWEVNFEAVELMNRLRKPDQLVIFPMTNNGYQPSRGSEYLNEESPWNAEGSLYTKSKYEAEQLLLRSGNVMSFRLASLFGVSPAMRWDLLIHFLIRKAFLEKRVRLFDPHFKRSFVPVTDVAECFFYAAQNSGRMKNQIFNLGLQSANMSKWDLAQMIKTFLPDFQIEIEKNETDPDSRDCFISVEKLKKAGFEASHSMRDGIFEVLEYLRSQNLTLRGVA